MTELESLYRELAGKIIQSVHDPLAQFYTINQVSEFVDQELEKLWRDIAIEVKLKQLNDEKRSGGIQNLYYTLRKIYEYFLDEKFDDLIFIQAIYHSRTSNSYLSATNPVERDMNIILTKVKKLIKKINLDLQKIKQISSEPLTAELKSLIAKTHNIQIQHMIQ